MPIIMPSPRSGKKPQIHESVFIAPTAVIIGDVTIEEGANIWFNALLRGDWGTIKIGKNTSIQENVTIHNEDGTSVTIGDDCRTSCDDSWTMCYWKWMYSRYRF